MYFANKSNIYWVLILKIAYAYFKNATLDDISSQYKEASGMNKTAGLFSLPGVDELFLSHAGLPVDEVPVAAPEGFQPPARGSG